jgi:putative chitinase
MSEVVKNNPNVVGSVAAWQNILNRCGYNPVLPITGQMDNATIATTIKFQQDLKLPQTGKITLDTWKAGLAHPKFLAQSNVTPPLQNVSNKILVSTNQILKLAPNAKNNYLEAFRNGQATLDRYEISNTPLRVAHFIAQIIHECGGLTIEFENLNYTASRLPEVWPSRFKPEGNLDPNEYARNPEKLANNVYGGRMGNTEPGDGFKYRGRGLLQLTGKESYAEATKILKKINPLAPDFVVSPDEVMSANWCLEVAASEWASKCCNPLADADDIKAITKRINGGYIGLSERTKWVDKTKLIWGLGTVA